MVKAGASSSDTRWIALWRDGLERGHGYDNWGQVIEACQEYDKVSEDVKKALTTEQSQFSEEVLRFLNKFAVIVNLRSKAVQDLTANEGAVSLGDIKALIDALKVMPSKVPDFPVAIADEFKHLIPAVTAAAPKQAAVVEDDDDIGDETGKITGGSLLPKQVFPGKTAATIRIDKIKLKDATSYIEPFFTISVKDAMGKDLCESQDTPPTNKKDEFVHFGQTVEIPKALEDLPVDCAIFLEFKHFKPRKNKISTKCFCLLEMDEIRKGQFPLEIYAKPTDFKRKKLSLLTEKPHYLYISISLTVG